VVVIVFSASSGWKKTTIVVVHRRFKPTILPLQPSTSVETTAIRILALRSTKSNHFVAGNLARKFHRLQQ
jgi:hypothetical protein